MGFSIKDIKYKQKTLLLGTNEFLSGPWFSFKSVCEYHGTLPIVLRNIEPTPIYKLVNSRLGRNINRITLDFDIKEYFKRLIREKLLKPIELKKQASKIRLYVDIFQYTNEPYLITFFTLKNTSDYRLIDFSMYFVFDFDINGLEGFDNDLSGYDAENDIIYQYDRTNVHAGFSTISKPTHYESALTQNFRIDNKRRVLSNTLYGETGEILSALQIEFKTLEKNQSFQTAFILSGGLNREELIENIKQGKIRAMKYLTQVNRSIKTQERNAQDKAFLKLNSTTVEECE